MLSRILYGTRVSLVVGGGGVALALAIGLLVGLLAGYARGWVDDVAMRLCDVQLSLPYLLFVVAIVGVLGPSLRNVVLVFGIADFPLFARMARGETLRLRATPFVESAIAVGASHARILLRHVLPNMAGVLLVVVGVRDGGHDPLRGGGRLPRAVGPADHPELGQHARRRTQLPHHVLVDRDVPGLAIVVGTLGINLLGNRLRRA